MATNENGSQNYMMQDEDNDTVGERERVWRVSKTKAQPPHKTAGWFSFQDFLSNNSLLAFHIYPLSFFSLLFASLSFQENIFNPFGPLRPLLFPPRNIKKTEHSVTPWFCITMPFYPSVPAKLKMFSGQGPPLYTTKTAHIMAATQTLLLAVTQLY